MAPLLRRLMGNRGGNEVRDSGATKGYTSSCGECPPARKAPHLQSTGDRQRLPLGRVVVRDMRSLRHLSLADLVIAVSLVGLLAAAFLPDTATSMRWKLERRARDWKPSTFSGLADESLLALDIDLAGEWINEHRLTRSSFMFTKRSPQQYDAEFATSGCLGGCRFHRMAYMKNGVVTLNEAVTEYMPRTYDTLYPIRIGERAYLVPADGVREFEGKLASGSGDWRWHVFERRDKSHAGDDAGERPIAAESNG